MEEYSQSHLQFIDKEILAEIGKRLNDFEDLRLQEMDKAGIDLVILSQTGPAVQGEQDTQKAISQAKLSNDFLAEQIARNPTRYAGFACLPMQSPEAAADELERTVKVLKFKGALVNGHSHGVYYDAPEYDLFWERMQALDVPLYLHPTNAYINPHIYGNHPEIAGAVGGGGWKRQVMPCEFYLRACLTVSQN